MAIRTIIEDGEGSVGDIADVKLTGDGKLSESAFNLVLGVLKAVLKRMNGGLTLGLAVTGHRAGNLDAQHITVLCPPTANQEFALPHGLGRTPVGYWSIEWDRAGAIYTSSKGSWSDSTMYLKCSVASATVALIVF